MLCFLNIVMHTGETMTEPVPEKQKSLAVRIASTATESEKVALKSWIEGMIKLRDSEESALVKIQKSIEMTATSGALLRLIELIGRELTPTAVTELMAGLSEINNGSLPIPEKISRATSLVWEKSKLVAWDDRGLAARVGMIAAIAGIVTFGSQGAGIAALGGAIGVPLWVIFGAGGAFLALLYQEITGKEIGGTTKATYRVIDAEKEE